MKQYRVVWQIELSTIVLAKSKQDAIEQVENLDCQNDGAYVADSFDIVKVEKFDEEL